MYSLFVLFVGGMSIYWFANRISHVMVVATFQTTYGFDSYGMTGYTFMVDYASHYSFVSDGPIYVDMRS